MVIIIDAFFVGAHVVTDRLQMPRNYMLRDLGSQRNSFPHISPFFFFFKRNTFFEQRIQWESCIK